MPGGAPTGHVHVVDDDPQLRGAVVRLLGAGGIPAEEWGSPAEFLRGASLAPPACVLLDLEMPGISGLELQAELRRLGIGLPVVFLTAHATVPDSVRALQGGALDFLEKPVATDRLLAAVRRGLQRSREEVDADARREGLARRLATLSAREVEVLRQLAGGASSKEAAAALGLSEDAVQIHRLRVMEQMEAGSFAELVRMAVALGLAERRPWE